MEAVAFFEEESLAPKLYRLPLCLATLGLAAVSVRCSIGLHPYSGMGKPPTFGDFEAQRHWMEITNSVPIADWYRNTTDNDLMYWGLDYPPLTAYHSYVCGSVLGWLEPEAMALHTSRGHETPKNKAAMRATVLVGDLAVYFPAVLVFVARYYGAGDGGSSSAGGGGSFTPRQRTWISLVLLLLPPLLLIDHGHFQFNTISLGFHAAGLALLAGQPQQRHSGLADAAATVLICLGVNYKQMCIYLVWPPFIYLVATNLRSHRPLQGLATLSVAALGTFALCWLPFLLMPKPLEAVGHVLARQFPFARGLYEDKVANVWWCGGLFIVFCVSFYLGHLLTLCVSCACTITAAHSRWSSSLNLF